MPELSLPAFDAALLGEVLASASTGLSGLDELRRAGIAGLIRGRLERAQLEALERHAPEALAVPSGSRIRLDYAAGDAPVLAARLQELFGLAETPRLAAGRVPIVLHILGPNYRPVQVTRDIRSFWDTTYAQVRKDLRARYPKHAWPEDPWQGRAERRPGGKRTRER
jgi:ATP-dependent helicase HrpB